MPKKPGFKDVSSIAVTLPDDNEDDLDDSDHEPTEEELLKMYESEQLRKLFIGNLSYQTNADMLRDYFGKHGTITDCNVPVDSRTRLSKGFGFVVYRESRTLDQVMRLRPHKLDGRVLEPRRAIRREEADNPAANASTNKCYIGPLDEYTTQDDLKHYFNNHGNVIEVERPAGKDHAFVTFDDFDPVDKCVNMKKHMIRGVIGICKKGLTKSAMSDAEKRYSQRKKRRGEREDRERDDYDLAKKGHRVEDDYQRYHSRPPHRSYPADFGRDDEGRDSRSRDRRSPSDRRRSPRDSRGPPPRPRDQGHEPAYYMPPPPRDYYAHAAYGAAYPGYEDYYRAAAAYPGYPPADPQAYPPREPPREHSSYRAPASDSSGSKPYGQTYGGSQNGGASRSTY